MSKFRHIVIKKEEASLKRRSKKIKEEQPSNFIQTISLMEKLGIKMVNNDNLLKSINLRKSTEIHIKKNVTILNEEEKQNKTIKHSSLQKRKKTITNKKEIMSTSYEKRIIKKDLIKKEDVGTNKIIKIKKYNEKKDVNKKTKKEKDKEKEKDNNIVNISAKKRVGFNNNDTTNKPKIIKKLKINEINESKKNNLKKAKAEKFININKEKEKDNSLTKKITEFKASLKPKSDKKEKEIFFTDIKNDDEELAKEIEYVFNNS